MNMIIHKNFLNYGMYILLMHSRYLDEKEIATVHGKYLAEEKVGGFGES